MDKSLYITSLIFGILFIGFVFGAIGALFSFEKGQYVWLFGIVGGFFGGFYSHILSSIRDNNRR